MDDLEERLRDDLRWSASREEPPVDAWDRITDRVQRGERRSTASRALIGTLVLAITAGGLFWLWRGFVATDEGPPTGQPEDLWGRTFVSTRVIEDGEPRTLVEGTRIHLTFFVERERRGLRGGGGCNNFGAGVEITADRLRLGEIEGTDQGCAQELHTQDEWLTAFLRSDPRWELRGDRLTLTSGETIIEFQSQADPEDLWGREFVSTLVIEAGEPRTLVPRTRIELTFFEERGGRGVRWSAGCNIFGAGVVITADHLVLGEIGGTQKGGSPECQAQDDWLAEFFRSDPRWELRDDRLTLSSDETIIELVETRADKSERPRSPRPTPYFPTHPGVGGPDVGLQGVLAVRDDCVVIASDAGVDILVLWPEVVGIEVENGVIQLVDEDGRVIASEGDRVSMGGGEAQPQVFREYAGRPPPACPDELWWGGLPIERLE